MLKQRVLWGSILIALITGLMVFDHTYQDNTGITLLFLAVVLLGLAEFYKMFEQTGVQIPKIFILLLVTILIVVPWVNSHSSFNIDMPFDLVLYFLLAGIGINYILRQDVNGAKGLLIALFGIIYVYWCMNFVKEIRGDSLMGESLFIYFIAVNKMADTMAYFGGKTMGKRLLAPKVSPKKTVAGLISAVIGGGLFSLVLWSLMPLLQFYSWYYMIMMGLLITMMGQLGDLLESLIKRYCQIKDSGSFLPGLGGMLDILDSLILSAPMAYYLMKIKL